jgi:biotin carboxyl carrier protein
MKLLVRIDEQPGELELTSLAPDQWAFRFCRDGAAETAGQASVLPVEPGIYSVLWDGRSYEVKVWMDGSTGVVDVGPEHFVVEAADPRELEASLQSTAHSSRQEIKAPMPGKVIRLLVDHQQEVAAGQGVLVVEAMKMQNEMQALRPGRVTAIHVRPGDTVAAGQVLAVIE